MSNISVSHGCDVSQRPACFISGFYFSKLIPQCDDVALGDRRRCGFYGINQVDCQTMGCCFKSDMLPFCFYRPGKYIVIYRALAMKKKMVLKMFSSISKKTNRKNYSMILKGREKIS